jgi:uncharacterized protein (DUF1684 family)
MRLGCGRVAICAGMFLALIGSLAVPERITGEGKHWRGELTVWREKHATELRKPDGWLSLVGLAWLQPGENSFGSAEDNKIRIQGVPAHLGILVLNADKTVELRAPAEGFDAHLLLGGVPATPRTIPVDPDSDKNAPHFTIGTVNTYVIRRADRFALRIKDSNSPARTGFHGLKWYAPRAKFDVNAKWVPYEPEKTVTLATSLPGISYGQPVPGAAEFILDGKTYRLEPVLEDPAEAQLFFVLRDATSSSTTYPACRFLYTGFPSQGLAKAGTLELDFNKLENPPCAYTPYATCPLPPPQNRLAIAIPVGEQRYHE